MMLIACCGIAAAVLGIMVNIAGLFFTPIAEEMNVGRGSVSLTLTISNLALALGGVFSPKVVTSQNFKKILLGAVAVFGLSTALLSCFSSLWPLYILSAVRGFAGGVAGTVLVTILLNHWFYEQTSLMISIAMAFAGIAGAVFSPVMSRVIEQFGWRTGYLVTAGIIVVLYLPVLLFPIGYFPEDAGTIPYGKLKKTEEPSREDTSKFPLPWLVLITCFSVLASFISGYPQHFPGIAESQGAAASQGALMLSIAMIANFTGKIIFGYLADRFGGKKTILLFELLVGGGSLLMLLYRPFAMFAAAGLIGMCYGVSNIGTVKIVRDMAGLHRYNEVYPLVGMIATIAAAASSSLVGFMYDASGSYTGALILAALLAAVIMVLVPVIYALKNKKTKEATP